MDENIIPSLPITTTPQYAVVTTNPRSEYGCGVFSWHILREDAEHNARITNGMVVPVDYIDGELIIPAYAEAAIRKGLFRDMRGYDF